jgi:TctA family transporter
MNNHDYEKVRARKQKENGEYFSDKSLVWAYLLCIPLGFLGFHCFYLNKPFKGLLYLFTGGLCGIGVIYDLFTLPTQVENVNYSNTKAKRNGWDKIV